MKKLFSLLLVGILFLSGCSSSNGGEQGKDEGDGPSETGSVYYVNFKPEQDAQWQELAEVYTAETGVEVKVLTAASGQYGPTVTAELAKTDMPTIIRIASNELETYRDYAADLSDTQLYSLLANDDYALKIDDKVAAIGHVIETYGIIYNKELLQQAGYTEADITNFETLKTVVEDITARKDELGFSAFSSAGMDASSDWRFKTHLANMPLAFEFRDDGIVEAATIKGTYLDNYKMIWDLYINNSTVEPGLLSTKTNADAVAEMLLKEAVFYQNGTWAYSDLAELGDDNLGMLPIYIGVEGEEDYGLSTGTENYWLVNEKAGEANVKASKDFLDWLITDEVALKALCGGDGAMPSGGVGMGFAIPFTTALESTNPLVNIANDALAAGKTPVSWNFTAIPSEEWKNGVGSALTAYAAGTGEWSAVVEAYVDGWASEYELANK